MAQQVALEERVARVEGALEQMNLRLGNLETEVRELRRELTAEIRELRRLMLQIFIPMWVTIILAILAVMLRV